MASRRGFTTGGLALLGVALSLTAPSLAAAGGRAGRLRRGLLGSGSPAALRDEDNVLDELYYFFGRELAASGSGSYSSSSGDGGGGGGGQSDPKPAPDIVIETDDDGETSGTDEDRDVDAEEGTTRLRLSLTPSTDPLGKAQRSEPRCPRFRHSPRRFRRLVLASCGKSQRCCASNGRGAG